MAYVMLGRSQKLEDIFILGKIDPKDIKVDPDALEETIRLENDFFFTREKKESFYKDHFTV